MGSRSNSRATSTAQQDGSHGFRRSGRVRCAWVVAAAIALGACGGTSGESGAKVDPSTITPVVEPLTGVDLASFEGPSEAADALPSDRYVSDLLGVQVAFDLPDGYERAHAYPGAIMLKRQTESHDGFQTLNFLAPSGFFDPAGRADLQPRGTVGPPEDLDPWLQANPELEILDSGEQSVVGGTARWWDIETFETDVCPRTCPLYLWEAGEVQWAIWPGYPQRVWDVDEPGGRILVAAEASTDIFETVAREATEVVSSMELGAETAVEAPTTADLAAGDFEVGQTSFTVVDESRATVEVVTDGDVVVEGAPRRSLEVEVGYPADATGWDVPPADGAFPVVLSAPGLGDLHRLWGYEDALVRAGYVVVKPRFPESSYPGHSLSGFHEQPADLSAVLDELVAGRGPELLADSLDLERVGAVGISAGGSTLHSTAAAPCCSDDRIDAFLIHGGQVAPPEKGWTDRSPPMLMVHGTDDPLAPLAPSEERFRELDAPAYLLTLETDDHLDWINDLSAPVFAPMLELNLAFLDAHLNGGETQALADLAARIDGEWREVDRG